MVGLNLRQTIEDYLKKERKGYAPACNYASGAGHPCARKLVYDRLNWQEKLLPNARTLMIFRDGNMHEGAVLRLLQDAGLTIEETQRPFEWPELQVRGRLDGRIRNNGSKIPLEVKSSNSFTWDSVNSQEDLKNASKYWVQGYYAQMQLYLFMANEEEGILLLKNKQTGQLKEIAVTIDYDYAEQIAQKLELVNKHVAARTYPERVSDRTVCQYCDFRHICLPDEESGQINIESDEELVELLEEREHLRDAAKEYDKVDKKLKEYWKKMEVGTYLIGARFQVKIIRYARTVYNIPDVVKEPYKDSTEYVKATITAVG